MNYKKISRQDFSYVVGDMSEWVSTSIMDNIGLDPYMWEEKLQKIINSSIKSFMSDQQLLVSVVFACPDDSKD